MYIYTPEQIRTLEDKANAAGLSYAEMMINAGEGCAKKIIKHCADRRRIVILCGKGKNGGDGFVIANSLFKKNFEVSVIKMFDEDSDPLSLQMLAETNAEIPVISFQRDPETVKSAIDKAEIITDAVFGIGFSGRLPEPIAAFFDYIKTKKAQKFAVDIPSGLTCSDPESIKTCFKADRTLSMLSLKREHILKPYSDYCGKISFIPIGFRPDLKSEFSYSIKEVSKKLPVRPYDSNKGTFGHALIVAGSYNMPGAAVIAAKGALSCGTGLVTLAFPDCCYQAVTAQLSENIMLPLRTADDGTISAVNTEPLIKKLNNYSSVAIGCGMTTSNNAKDVLFGLIKNYPGTLIIDADGINIISGNIDILKEAVGHIIMTPHPAEMSRLTMNSVDVINSNREECARNLAREYNIILLLKGANTVVASPDGDIYINPTGCSALARGGSGDLLTGMIASLAAQGMKPFEAACTGAFIHGLAGEKAEQKYTAYGSTTSLISSCIPDALSHIIKGNVTV